MSEPLLEGSDYDGTPNAGAGPPPRKKKVATTAPLCGVEVQYVMLLCICFLTFGSYWVYDTPGAIETQLEKWFGKGYGNTQNSLLYSIYSWPNTVLAFFGGFIIDRLTVRVGAAMFCSLVFLGELIFCFGVQYKIYWVCVVGRFVFGLGGESLTVAQNTLTVRWFDGPILALAFGLVLAFARIGSSVNFVVTPILATDVPLSVWFGGLMCLISLTMCGCGCAVDYWAEKKRNEEIASEPKPQMSSDAHTQNDTPEEEAEAPPDMRHVRYFPSSAWLLFFICLFFYIGVLVFYQVASKIMQETGHKYGEKTASTFLSIPNFVSIVASPTFGRLVDRKGRALYCILVASSMLTLGHVAFLANAESWTEISPIPIMIWIGFCYSLGAASLWPILSVIIDRKMLGTAYGCMTAVQNTGLAIFPLLISGIQGAPGIKGTLWKYTAPCLVFIACEGVAFFLTVILIGIDRSQNAGRMNMSSSEREEFNKIHGDLTRPMQQPDQYPSADSSNPEPL